MRASWFTAILIGGLTLGCGGPQDSGRFVDESGDLEVRSNVAAIPPGIDGTRWRWVGAHCTEGPLDLLSRGYAAHLRVEQLENGLRLVTDQQFATEDCHQTVVQHATLPGDGGSDWQMEEVARVAVPSTRQCVGRREAPRPGAVRMEGPRLEVLVQRSQWCDGLEVRMVFERAADTVLEDDEIVRRYVAHFTRGDADAVAGLFADTGSLLEPFTQTETGDPYRHDGRDRVRAWFAETFSTAPWRAMRVLEVEQPEDGHMVVRWEYMDPRLTEPFEGSSRFTIAAGEIFELAIELRGEPSVREPGDGEDVEAGEESG